MYGDTSGTGRGSSLLRVDGAGLGGVDAEPRAARRRDQRGRAVVIDTPVKVVTVRPTAFDAAAPGDGGSPVEAVVRPVRAILVGDSSRFLGRWYPGQARATQEVNIAFEVSGRIVEVSPGFRVGRNGGPERADRYPDHQWREVLLR